MINKAHLLTKKQSKKQMNIGWYYVMNISINIKFEVERNLVDSCCLFLKPGEKCSEGHKQGREAAAAAHLIRMNK